MKTLEKHLKLFTLLARIRNAADAIMHSDKMILNNINRPSLDGVVNLHYWDSSIEIGEDCNHNLGDDLSPIIVNYMLDRNSLSLRMPIDGKKHLYAVGSIISMGYQKATIWGSGFLEPLSSVRRIFHHRFLRKLDIRCVRGPETRKVLVELGHSCPQVYGDPAMLLPLVYRPKAVEKTIDYLLIPHFSKEKEYKEKIGGGNFGSMITNDYRPLIDKICSSKLVISGSLHGIILAEAYGVPAIFLRDRDAKKDFKYNDYYASTLRPAYKYASTIEEALKMEPMSLPPNIKELQTNLIDSFPYDLWRNI